MAQLFVLGMHRSGTSAVARILNMMGAYFGPEEASIGASEENPKGFWERRDVRDLNDYVLKSLGADWNRVGHFEFENLSDSTMKEFEERAKPIIEELNSHTPWMLKEPRICLLYPLWQKLVDNPVCIHVIRSPIEVAQSLQKRNGYPLNLGVALWEKYNVKALEHSSGSPRILIRHGDLMADPITTVNQLWKDITDLEVSGLHQLNDQEISEFIDPKLYRNKSDRMYENSILTKEQRVTRNFFESSTVLDENTLPPLSKAAEDTLTTFDATEAERLLLCEKLDNKIRPQIKQLKKDYLELQSKSNTLQKQLTQSEKATRRLQTLLERAKKASQRLTQSRRWKLGNLLSFSRKRGKDGSIPYQPLSNVFDLYDDWKKDREK